MSKIKEKLESFLINLLIYEGRHYAIQNMDSYVLVRLMDKKKCTKIRKKTDCPYYNEYFTFECKKIKLQKLLDSTLVLTVIQPASCWRRKKILGYISMDLATVWDQTDHQFYHKWAVISAEDFAGGPKGYLKVDISITTIGSIPKIPLIIPEDTDVIEGNLLLPEGMTLERQRANFIFKIFKGEDFIKQVRCCKEVISNVRLEILFVGLKSLTSVQKSTLNPVWNESIIFTELFPPLCQRIKLTIKYVACLHKSVQIEKYINLRYISNDNEHGFLPTFGPSYLFFYNNNAYAGKILASLGTVLHDESLGIPKSVTKQEIDVIKEEDLWVYENVFLFVAIFEITHIVPKEFKDHKLSVELHFGNTMKDIQEVNEAGDYFLQNKSIDYTLVNNDGEHYHFVDLEEKYPCLHIISSWPDFRRRLFLSNMIGKIAVVIKSKMDEIEFLFKQEAYFCIKENIRDKLIDVIDHLTISCRKFLDIINHKPNFFTILDRERLHWIIREMGDIELQSKEIYNPSKRKKTFRKLTYLYKRLEFLIQDEQECYPDVFIWITSGTKRLSHVRIPSRDIIYSAIKEESGNDCSNVKDIFFKLDDYKGKKKINQSNVICKINTFMWIGLERQNKFCFSSLPENFAIPEGIDDVVPKYLITKEKNIFQCRVYIYQGRIKPGLDATSFSDPFIRVIIRESCKKSKVIKKSLNPMWNQTILFQNVIFYGSKNYVKKYPPNVILEIYDKDACCKEEYVGRIIIMPRVNLSHDDRDIPKMKWEKFYDENENEKGEILCTAELLEMTEDNDMANLDDDDIISIPEEMKPKMEKFRLEILYWGFRLFKKIHHLPITRPKIEVCCLDSVLKSPAIHYNNCMNFDKKGDYIDLYLPSEIEYSPPLIITLHDRRSFGRNTFGGIYVSLIKPFLFDLMTETERTNKLFTRNYSVLSFDSQLDLLLAARERQEKELQILGRHINKEEDIFMDFEKKSFFGKLSIVKCFVKLLRKKHKKQKNEIKEVEEEVTHIEELDDEVLDWWTKYYNSLDPIEHFQEMTKHEVINEIQTQDSKQSTNISPNVNKPKQKNYKLKIYNNELELQPEFNGFTDLLQIYPMFKGKRTGDDIIDNENITGIFKGSLRIYKYDENDDIKQITPNGYDIRGGAFQEWPSNEREPFLLRVYCIRGIRLISKDKYGATDAYISIRLGQQHRKYKEDYVPNQFNPIFGKCYELQGYFPEDYCLVISVWDHDKRCKDDLIGETKIDIENRFYTKHRARCGLAMDYTESGYSSWRGQLNPTQILDSYCHLYNINAPTYTENSVLIANKHFVLKTLEEENPRIKKECIALYALNHWHEMPLIGHHFVPEHVETRSLYHPAKPGIEQGKLKIWIDMFPCRYAPPPPPVDITPQLPISYEFRVIIWNTEDVILDEDDFFTGERKSDIYVKGWMEGENREQCTDVHYRSFTGEGNFNWRFVFNFDYLTCEKKVVVQRSTMYDEDTEEKYPCRLKLQVWDNDTFSRNDFLGSVTLELNRLPRSAKTSKKCSLMILNTNSPKINLFKMKKIRGWWPFRQYNKETNEYILAGKLEAEFELVLQEEADSNPVGLGRDEPQALPPPKRPEMSFSFMKNPFRALKYLCCKLYRCKIIMCCTFFFLIFFVVIAFYSFPGYTIKRILGA